MRLLAQRGTGGKAESTIRQNVSKCLMFTGTESLTSRLMEVALAASLSKRLLGADVGASLSDELID